ncbi:Dbl homology domain-containing protein [Mycotypha africana]|uniref:rho guanine nucleotide exchange factor n=1 Tax=Mycotypha africana TaxID=64632 RepID=UPI002300F528|nr:rho guanine nucleotide exchange factor [Mycotypha africana]KAI8968266.1 Dbl homology domain-containing protein [Mycotypha africana]
MPPFICPTFEEIEAKEWAAKTVKNILTEVSPVSLESDLFLGYNYNNDNMTTAPATEAEAEAAIAAGTKKATILPVSAEEEEEDRKNNLRRSFSLLEGSLFSLQHPLSKEIRNSRRALSTIVPSTAESRSSSTKSAPTTPAQRFSINPRSNTTTIATSSKHLFDNNAIYILRTFELHKKSNKERKGVLAWRSKYTEYVINPPHHLQLKPKPYSRKSMQLFKFIMAELLTTEETYLNHLTTIKNFYMDPLIEAASPTTTSATTVIHLHQQKPLVNLKDVEIIFAFIPQLIVLSTVLVHRLHECITNYLEDDRNLNDVCIGKIMCEFESYFSIYISYSVNFTKSRKHLAKASSNIVYRQLVQKETNRMVLADYMIAPIQRITRYGLLLTDLQKHSSTKHPDYPYLDRARKCMSALAYAMNTIQR